MTDLEKFERVNNLLLCYGDALTSLQKEVLTSYYSYNLSLSEIASERKVSRAAIDDALKKGVNKLEELEKYLKVNEKNDKLLKITAKIKQNNEDNQELLEEIDEIERIITDGI